MSIYENNLNQLKSTFPEVYEWIMEEDEDKQLELIRTGNGLNNVRIKGLQGRSSYLYDMDDPLKEGEVACNDKDFSPDKVTFLLGIGLGYIIDEIKDKMEKGHKVIVIEKSATMLKMALAQTDISGLLEEGSVIFSLPDDENIKANVARYSYMRYQEDVIIIYNNRLMGIRKEYLDLKHLVMRVIGNCMVSTFTGLNNSEIFVDNEIDNLPKFLFASGIKNLFDKFEKVPGIIVSAGPSLENNVHLLKEAMGKALLIATAPVARVLLGHDIRPDLIISIDFTKANRLQFKGICDCTDIPLVWPVKITPSIIRDFQGDMFAIQELVGLSAWLRSNWEFKGYVRGGGSVAIFALMTAIACGCDPIIFVGQDLSLSDKTHVSGSLGWRSIDREVGTEEFLWVDGIHGGKVLTSPSFIGYQRSIEEIIREFDRTYINSTARGVKISGTEVVPLRECIETYCKAPIDTQSIISESRNTEHVTFDGLTRNLETILEKMREISQLCVQGLKSNKRIKKRLGRGLINDPETDKIILDNYNTSTRVQEHCEAFPPLSTFLKKDIYRINRQEYKYESSEYDKKKDLCIGLRRNRLIMLAAQRALKKVRVKFRDLIRVLKKIEMRKRKLDGNDMDGKFHYRYGRVLGEIGLHKLAIEEYENALELGEDYFHTIYNLGISYIGLGMLSKARNYFDQAQHREKSESLLQRRYEQIEQIKDKWLEEAESYLADKNWVNALLYARKLLREYPDHQRAQEIAKEAKALRDETVCGVKKANEEERAQRSTKEEYEGLIEQAKKILGKQDYHKAVDCFKQALELEHDQDEVNMLLACCYSEMGDIDEAKRLFEELSAKFPQSGLFHLNLGRGFIRNGRFVEAAEQLELAASKQKKYYYVLFEAGAIHMKANDYDKAIECFEKYLEMSPDSYELLAKIGTCYLAKGVPWKAKKKYREALRVQPDYEAAQMGLRNIEEMEGRMRLKDRPNGLEERYA